MRAPLVRVEALLEIFALKKREADSSSAAVLT